MSDRTVFSYGYFHRKFFCNFENHSLFGQCPFQQYLSLVSPILRRCEEALILTGCHPSSLYLNSVMEVLSVTILEVIPGENPIIPLSRQRIARHGKICLRKSPFPMRPYSKGSVQQKHTSSLQALQGGHYSFILVRIDLF